MHKKEKNVKKSPTSVNDQQLQGKILQLLNGNRSKDYKANHVITKLGFKHKSINKQIPIALATLWKEGKIRQLKNGAYKSNQEPESLIGIVDHVNVRFAYIVFADKEEDTYVKDKDLNFAMDGDTVKVAVHRQQKHGRKSEGKIIEIIARRDSHLVGRIEFSQRFAFVIPDNRKIHADIFVSLKNVNRATHNDKVLLEITQWPDQDKNPEGKVVRVLGQAGENNAEIHSIMAEFGLPFEFEKTIEEEANRIEGQITKKEIKKRRDFRNITTFTIDPLDAKDFDDAISLQKLKNGHYEIGIHIADVTHYVKPKMHLEKEAYHRATSVYLVDRTIPMLPERLSNDICSLRPNEDKCTFSAVFEIDENGKVHREWFGRTLIHSNRRFTYEEAQECIESKQGDFAQEINILNELAHRLKDKRFVKGAINFETTEVEFRLAEDGRPLEVITKVRKDAHKLIEEFMLLANRQVATYIFKMNSGKNKNIFVYRTHDTPDPEKINTLSQFANKFGHRINANQEKVSKAINGLLEDIKGKPEQNILQLLAIRAMAKAKYTTDPDGHFGLGFEHYSHFTSPIRRYPDMMTHRLLQHYLDGGKSVDKQDYEEKCLHSSEREKRAANAERNSIKYKQVEFMQFAEKKVYEGVISGVVEWGVFVEITKTKCEGLVRMVDLKDDFYEFDEDNCCIVGKRNKKMYTLGDSVYVRIKHTDIDRRTIDLSFETQ